MSSDTSCVADPSGSFANIDEQIHHLLAFNTHLFTNLNDQLTRRATSSLVGTIPSLKQLHMASEQALSDTSGEEIQLSFTHHGAQITFEFSRDAVLNDLSNKVAAELSIPASNQKFLISPKLGLQKPPFKNPYIPLTELLSKKITLVGSTASEISALNSAMSAASVSRKPSSIKAATPSRYRDVNRIQEEAMYTFHTLRPLPYLPNPDRSLKFLERLRNDPGIKAAMRTHKFSVPLLTEMDPAMHTTHESRTLGLNRNQGEVIELRLRTDAYDGYRDYKTIRKTLCHELAHNVHGPHDRNFWDLCKQIEREVERDDWKSGGRAVGNEEYYEPDEVYDHGGWTGGEFVLGGGGDGHETVVGNATGSIDAGNLSRREILARAAEERMKRAKQAEQDRHSGGSGTSTS
jgi:hypothetical protein